MPDENKPDSKPDSASIELAALKAQHLELTKKYEATLKPEPKPDPENDLNSKAQAARELKEKTSATTKQLESALRFNMEAPEFIKNNSSLLPKDVEGIFTAASKETYADPIEKDSAIKSAIVQSFFQVQSNLDLLTQGPKHILEEFLKLTKTGKQDKAQEVFANVFEPAFEMLKKVKKAEALGKGFAPQGDDETAYKNKLMARARQQYLGEKPNA